MLKTLYSLCGITLEQKIALQGYVSTLKRHQQKLNLVGASTLKHIWVRHVIDSMQVYKYLPKEKKNKLLLDVGTGAGFPGIVLAIMGRKDVLLCDKSPKKTMFLNTVINELSIEGKVINLKIENIFKKNISIIVSRAFASLKKLISSVQHLLASETTLVIHKGKKYKREIVEAKKYFSFTVKIYNSITSNEGVILRITNIEKK